MTAKTRLREIFDREERALLRRIDLIERGQMRTHTNGLDDTHETLKATLLSLAEIREARSLLS